MACSTQDLTTLGASLGSGTAQLLCSKLQTPPTDVVPPESVNALFILLCGAVIFFMHTGFAMVGLNNA